MEDNDVIKIKELISKTVDEFKGQLPASKKIIMEEVHMRIHMNGIGGLLVHCGTLSPEDDFDSATDQDIANAIKCWLSVWYDEDIGPGLWGSL